MFIQVCIYTTYIDILRHKPKQHKEKCSHICCHNYYCYSPWSTPPHNVMISYPFTYTVPTLVLILCSKIKEIFIAEKYASTRDGGGVDDGCYFGPHEAGVHVFFLLYDTNHHSFFKALTNTSTDPSDALTHTQGPWSITISNNSGSSSRVLNVCQTLSDLDIGLKILISVQL